MLLAEQSAAGDKVPHLANREIVQGWLDAWAGEVLAAVDALAPLLDLPAARPDTASSCRAAVVTECQVLLASLGLAVPAALSP